ncbi:hypothetical protein N431DRAFT_429293 [Stipitochalara longipes BDJ]|nr:hypothetical protein N431DRAFT_429293 [Stipitochalara longipes BDJ]
MMITTTTTMMDIKRLRYEWAYWDSSTADVMLLVSESPSEFIGSPLRVRSMLGKK